MNTATKRKAHSLATELRPSILRLSRHLRRESNQIGSSSLDMQILRTIGQNPGVTVAVLAAGEQMTRSAMSEHIKRLELRGFVKRTFAKQDRPGKPIDLNLTLSGNRHLKELEQCRTDWLASRIDLLSIRDRALLDRATRSLRLILP